MITTRLLTCLLVLGGAQTTSAKQADSEIHTLRFEVPSAGPRAYVALSRRNDVITATDRQVVVHSRHDGSVLATFDPDCRVRGLLRASSIYLVCTDQIRVLQLNGGQITPILNLTQPPIAFAASHRFFAVATRGGKIALFDSSGLMEDSVVVDGEVQALALQMDDPWLGELTVLLADGRMKLLPIERSLFKEPVASSASSYTEHYFDHYTVETSGAHIKIRATHHSTPVEHDLMGVQIGSNYVAKTARFSSATLHHLKGRARAVLFRRGEARVDIFKGSKSSGIFSVATSNYPENMICLSSDGGELTCFSDREQQPSGYTAPELIPDWVNLRNGVLLGLSIVGVAATAPVLYGLQPSMGPATAASVATVGCLGVVPLVFGGWMAAWASWALVKASMEPDLPPANDAIGMCANSIMREIHSCVAVFTWLIGLPILMTGVALTAIAPLGFFQMASNDPLFTKDKNAAWPLVATTTGSAALAAVLSYLIARAFSIDEFEEFTEGEEAFNVAVALGAAALVASITYGTGRYLYMK